MSALEKPYVEVGAGISNIFRLFRVDGLWRLTHRNNRVFMLNFAMDLDF